MRSLKPIALSDLILSRLLIAGADTITTGEIKDAVKAIATYTLSPAEFSEQLNHTFTVLVAQEHIQAVRPSRYEITASGRQHILKQLGLDTVLQKFQWKTLKEKDWIAYALHLPGLTRDTRQRFDSDRLRAAILRHCFELPIDPFSSLTKARDALLWQQLCDPSPIWQQLCDPSMTAGLRSQLPQLSQQTFSQGKVMAALLNNLLRHSKALSWDKALNQLVAKVIHAKRTDANELRSAIFRQALVIPPLSIEKPQLSDSTEANPLPNPQVAEPSTSDLEVRNVSTSVPSLEEFATAVLGAVQATQEGWFGENKVFISHVWETFKQQYPAFGLTLDTFKQHLLAANQQRFLNLSRADLAYALDPEAVATSAIPFMHSAVHFIHIE